jgi:hypothetical protein
MIIIPGSMPVSWEEECMPHRLHETPRREALDGISITVLPTELNEISPYCYTGGRCRPLVIVDRQNIYIIN